MKGIKVHVELPASLIWLEPYHVQSSGLLIRWSGREDLKALTHASMGTISVIEWHSNGFSPTSF